MTFNKYKFVRYSKEYPKLYKKEEAKIKKILGNNVNIEHVGSTSVPSLGGKGIIDIAIRTPKSKINYYINKLNKIGYKFNPEHPGTNKSKFLQRRIISKGKERRIHVHLFLNNAFWDTFIIFRDYLKKSKKARDEYVKIKKKAAVYSKQEGKRYRAYKERCILNIMKKAKENIK